MLLSCSNSFTEVRTPMNVTSIPCALYSLELFQGILCAAEILKEELEHKNKIQDRSLFMFVKEHLDIIRINAVFLTEIIENMLSFSQVHSLLSTQSDH
jgi:signal transduction histidine kinase